MSPVKHPSKTNMHLVRNRLSFFFGVIAVIFILATVQSRRSGQSNLVMESVTYITSVVSQGSRTMFSWSERMVTSLTKGSDLLRERDQLTASNAGLLMETERLKLREQELDELRKQVDLTTVSGVKTRYADVRIWLPTPDTACLMIANPKGGVRLNSTIRTSTGLVGKVSNVGALFSTVRLIQDRSSHVGVKVIHGGDVIGTGILTGEGMNAEPQIKYMRPELIVSPGDNVVTSGEGGVYRANIPVGTVRESIVLDGAAERVAYVKIGTVHPTAIQTVILLEPYPVVTPSVKQHR